MKKLREWISSVLAKWTLYVNPNYNREWKARWGPDGFMIVPRSWVQQEKIDAEKDWWRMRRA